MISNIHFDPINENEFLLKKLIGTNFTIGSINIYISGAETGLVLLVPGTTNNSVNVIQNGLKIIH